MLEKLTPLFESDTIRPTFERVHVVLALFMFEEHVSGLGRYRLRKELLIGSGTSRSLIEKLKESSFLAVHGHNKRKGHVLTDKGRAFVAKIREVIPVLKKGDIDVLKDVIVESQGVGVFFCQVKNAASRVRNGIQQRDAAIKIGGTGATCFVLEGGTLTFALQFASENDREKMKISQDVQEYFRSEIQENGSELEDGDVIIVGLGGLEEELESLRSTDLNEQERQGLAEDNSFRRARLSAMAAALTLIKK